MTIFISSYTHATYDTNTIVVQYGWRSSSYWNSISLDSQYERQKTFEPKAVRCHFHFSAAKNMLEIFLEWTNFHRWQSFDKNAASRTNKLNQCFQINHEVQLCVIVQSIVVRHQSINSIVTGGNYVVSWLSIRGFE